MKQIHLHCGEIVQVDDENYEELMKYNWYCEKEVFAVYRYTKDHQRIFMHNQIMRPPVNKEVDHIDHNRLNNCVSNLRNCTHSQNLGNQLPAKGRRFKGVFKYYYRKKTQQQTWIASLESNGQIYNCGVFDNEIEAAVAYDRMARKVFGQYAYYNFRLKDAI